MGIEKTTKIEDLRRDSPKNLDSSRKVCINEIINHGRKRRTF